MTNAVAKEASVESSDSPETASETVRKKETNEIFIGEVGPMGAGATAATNLFKELLKQDL